MKKWMIVLLVGLGAVGLGVGGAAILNKVLPASTEQNAIEANDWLMGPGQFGLRQGDGYPGQLAPSSPRYRGGMGGGMMGGQYFTDPSNTTAERISMDQAVTAAQTYIKDQSATLKVSEVMEFEKNFYVAVTESDSGRGAFELLVNPVTGRVTPEIGANMMWNLKYSSMRMMQSANVGDNTVTLEQARAKAQAALTDQVTGGTLNDGGFSFYGYYTFDYSVDGKITGMLSVNGLDGRVMFHTWHGEFITEKEF